MDVYRVGTLLEMVWTVARSLTKDSATVKVCVQQSMGESVFQVPTRLLAVLGPHGRSQGSPLSLVTVRRIMEVMD